MVENYTALAQGLVSVLDTGGSLGYEEEECAICAAGTGLSLTTAQLSLRRPQKK